MMPLWVFTLGATLFRDREATIPYMNMVGSLILLTLPLVIGIFIKKYSPRLTRFSNKIIKPFTIIIVLCGIGIASYVNRFVFLLFTWRVVVAGMGIAWGGYTFGALMSWLCRLERAQIVAISIETAFQNPAVAFVLLLLTLPQPDARFVVSSCCCSVDVDRNTYVGAADHHQTVQKGKRLQKSSEAKCDRKTADRDSA
ncbi:p3 protein [Trichonephila clavata]|uniref:p3 protein n=1 Tax=Trichonephila clavata TaxID=2740835 RepID=A0A8X6I2S2_TRICU|nr:p3 protein [Trichonephila clavata]